MSAVLYIVKYPSCVNPNDSLHQTLDIVGDKWSMQIIMHLHKNSLVRFGGCQEANGINAKTLTQRFHALANEGLIEKREYKEHPPCVEYELTDKGGTLVLVIQ